MHMDTRQLHFYQWSVCLPLSFAPSCSNRFICIVVQMKGQQQERE